MEEIKEVSPRNNEDLLEDSNYIENNNYTNTNNNLSNTKTPGLDDRKDFIDLTSEGTLKHETEFEGTTNYNFNLENEFKETIENNPKEDIDNYIDNMKNIFNKSKMMRLNTNKKTENENSDNTVENNTKNLVSNPNNIILEDIRNFF